MCSRFVSIFFTNNHLEDYESTMILLRICITLLDQLVVSSSAFQTKTIWFCHQLLFTDLRLPPALNHLLFFFFSLSFFSFLSKN